MAYNDRNISSIVRAAQGTAASVLAARGVTGQQRRGLAEWDPKFVTGNAIVLVGLGVGLWWLFKPAARTA